MEKKEMRAAGKQVGLAALCGAIVSLFALALAAVFVKNFALPQPTVTAINWSVKCLASFLGSVLFVKGERALFKGAGAGVLYTVLTLLLFAAIGGGFHIDGFFVLELAVCGILGGVGGLLGAKLRKA